MYINPIPVLVLRAILPLPFPMHKQCRQIMDRFLAVDRSFVIVPPLTKKKAKRKKGGNHNAISAVRKSIFERFGTHVHIVLRICIESNLITNQEKTIHHSCLSRNFLDHPSDHDHQA